MGRKFAVGLNKLQIFCITLLNWNVHVADGRHEMGQLFVSFYVYVVCSSLPPWFGAIDVNGIR